MNKRNENEINDRRQVKERKWNEIKFVVGVKS